MGANFNGSLSVKPSSKIILLYSGLFLCALVLKYMLISEMHNFELIWRAGVLAGTSALAYCFLRRMTTTYTINAIEVTGETGILSKKITRIPLNRISNYETFSSFTERILGLTDVLIDTPGGAAFELKLLELDKKDADCVTKVMRELIAQQKIAEAGSNDKLREMRERALAS